MKIYLSSLASGPDMKQGGTQIAPELVPLGSQLNGVNNYWANEGTNIILPCFSYGNPPPLTRYAYSSFKNACTVCNKNHFYIYMTQTDNVV